MKAYLITHIALSTLALFTTLTLFLYRQIKCATQRYRQLSFRHRMDRLGRLPAGGPAVKHATFETLMRTAFDGNEPAFPLPNLVKSCFRSLTQDLPATTEARRAHGSLSLGDIRRVWACANWDAKRVLAHQLNVSTATLREIIASESPSETPVEF